MDQTLQSRILAAWVERPEEVRYSPATPAQIKDFEKRFGAIPADFRWFLGSCGGGVVGSEWVDGIEALAETHMKFSEESALPMGWRMRDVFVVGWDGSGNPFGLEVATGKVLVEDHDFGGIHEMAPSFAAFLGSQLFGDER